VPTRRAAKGTGWLFWAPFLWFISFGEAKEMNKTTLGMQKNRSANRRRARRNQMNKTTLGMQKNRGSLQRTELGAAKVTINFGHAKEPIRQPEDRLSLCSEDW